MATVSKDPAAQQSAAEIRAGIERARQEIELSVADLRNEVARTLDVRRLVRERPAAWLGGAFAAGFLLAWATSSRRSDD